MTEIQLLSRQQETAQNYAREQVKACEPAYENALILADYVLDNLRINNQMPATKAQIVGLSSSVEVSHSLRVGSALIERAGLSVSAYGPIYDKAVDAVDTRVEKQKALATVRKEIKTLYETDDIAGSAQDAELTIPTQEGVMPRADLEILPSLIEVDNNTLPFGDNGRAWKIENDQVIVVPPIG